MPLTEELTASTTGTRDSSMNRVAKQVPPKTPQVEPDGGPVDSRVAEGVFSMADIRQRQIDEVEEKAKIEAEMAAAADPYAGMTSKQKKAAEKARKRLHGTFEQYPVLLNVKPKERYFFRSDYYQIDSGVACVLGFFHEEAAQDNFGAFWGINRIPASMPDGVTAVVLESVRPMGEKWVADHLKTSEHLSSLSEKEVGESTGASSKRKTAKKNQDVDQISGELLNGAAYLHVHNRLLLKAPTLELLEEAIEKIDRLYVERFSGTLKVAPYYGEQRQELSSFMRRNDKKRGPGFHFTSIEFAGAHSLVTNGLNDTRGEYVGRMVGDVNNSAVLMDIDGQYENHIVVADPTMNEQLGRTRMSNLWGSKISQSALLNNHKVVHIVLDGTDLDRLGPRLDSITARLDLNVGDINMLEMFGEEKDELSIFPAHLDKIALMAIQIYSNPDDQAFIKGYLKETLTKFYVDKNMWYQNAKANRDRLRVVNLPHEEVPRLQDIVTYFDTEKKALVQASAADQDAISAYSKLRLLFREMLDANGDLFNATTNSDIDGVGEARRVIYDFSNLARRGTHIAMAQLVNVIGFAVSSLGHGDVVLIHGTDTIDENVKGYISTQLHYLRSRGGRVVFLYNEIESMLKDKAFNAFDQADYTVLGTMLESSIAEYQKLMSKSIPPDLEKLVVDRTAPYVYLRRGTTNVVFEPDLALGVNPDRQRRREELKTMMDAVPFQGGRAILPDIPVVEQTSEPEPESETVVFRPQRGLASGPGKAAQPVRPRIPAPARVLPKQVRPVREVGAMPQNQA